jgi:serine/threonine-protein kinase
LSAQLRGDLDAIVMKALRKEPTARYDSAEALAEDVERHLLRQPVQARRGGWRYRGGRFLRRHALATALGGIAACSLIGGLAVTLWQAHALRSEVLKSTQALNFMIGVFTSADTGKTSGREISAVELLDQARLRIRTEVQDSAARSELLLAIARSYRGLSKRLDTLPLTEEAVQLRRAIGQPLGLAQALALRSASLHDLRRFDDALASLDEAAALDLGQSAAAASMRIELQSRRANVLMNLGRVSEAETAFASAYAEQRTQLGEHDPATQETGVFWAFALISIDRYAQARAVLEPIVAAMRVADPAQPNTLAFALDALAVAWQHDDPARTLQYGREALEQERIAYGDDSTHTAQRMLNLANYLVEVGEYVEAQQLADNALAMMRAHAAENPGIVFPALKMAAAVHLLRDDPIRAEPLLNEAIALRDSADAKPAISVAWVLLLRARMLAMLDRHAESQADYNRAELAIAELPANSWRKAFAVIERAATELEHAVPDHDCSKLDAAAATVQQQLGDAALLAQWSEALTGACASTHGDVGGRERMQRAQALLQNRLPAEDARLRWLDRFVQRH